MINVSSSISSSAQKVKKFHTLTQPALHHFRTHDHLSHNRGDLGRTEIEFFIEILDRVEDLAMAQVRIVQRRNLRAFLRQEVDLFVEQPAILLRLSV